MHSAQVGFPGGKLEEQDLSYTRYGNYGKHYEEIGVSIQSIKVAKRNELRFTFHLATFYVQPLYWNYSKKHLVLLNRMMRLKPYYRGSLAIDFLDDNQIIITESVSTSYSDKCGCSCI